MVENLTIDCSACRILPEPKFQSMEDIKRASKALRLGENTFETREKINSYREFRSCCLETSLKILSEINLPKNALVSARLKRMQSIDRKLTRNPTFYVHELDDIVGFRIILQSLDELRSVITALNSSGIKVKNYLEEEHPCGTGYRGGHAFFSFKQPFDYNGKEFKVRFEVQLRTYYQHMWACWCEGMGEQAKEGWCNRRNEPEIKEKITHLKSISKKIKMWEQKNSDAVQKSFPSIDNLSQKFAVVRGDENGYIGAENYHDSTEAFEIVKYYEEDRGLRALFLLGLSSDDIESHLRETHLNWFSNVPEPEYWLPK